ncbi:MAG: DUF167 domain-containing protein [Prochlorococcus sp.]
MADKDIPIRVTTRARSTQIVGEQEGVVVIKLRAAPVNGEANDALLKFLAKQLGVAQRNVYIVRGSRSHNKWLRVYGMSAKEVRDALLR